MENSKEIKIYGTLVNQTIDPNKSDVLDPLKHHDAIANAKELFDERFHTEDKYSQESVVEKYQDRINRRVTGISYSEGNPGVTTIDGDLYVTGDTNIGGELNVQNDAHFHEDVYVDGDTHVTNLIVTGDTNLTLNDLADVNVTQAGNNEALVYDLNTHTWVPKNVDGVEKLDDLEDVDVDSAHDGETIVFDDYNNKWIPGKPSLNLNDLGDVNSASPAANQLLMFNGTVWAPVNADDVCLWKIQTKVVNGVSQPCIVPTKNYPIYIPEKGVYDGSINS